jgi:lipoprotein NlpD
MGTLTGPATRVAALSVAAGLVAIACASTPEPAGPSVKGPVVGDRTHVLRPGENLYRLSLHYGVSIEAIQRANRVADPTALSVGQRLRIPNARSETPPETLAKVSFVPSSVRRAAQDLELAWPVRGRLSSKFGRRGRGRHDGIDIPAKKGTPVRAAQAGKVIHSGTGLGDYGKVVILKHEGRYSTVYAHNNRNRVRKGQFVEKGDVIGEVGSTGNASGTHVHFEVRRDREPVDPLLYLP